jgi:uridine kinase
MHGQLDIIPTTFLSGAVYFLLKKDKKQTKGFIIMFSAALLTKFHIIAVMPIFLIYIFNKFGIKKTITISIEILFIVILVVLPFWCEGFIQTVVFNHEQNILTEVYFTFTNMKIIVPVFVILFLYITVFISKSINTDLLISFCGVLFSAILICVPSMPGWYVWVVPFITIFFINVDENKYKNISIFAGLNFTYVIYFVFLKNTQRVDLYFLDIPLSMLKINDKNIENVVFTILECLMVYASLIIYKSGVSSNSLYKRRNMPFTIGIAGDSASGKSTFITLLESCLGRKNILYIEGDGDHKWERGEKMWNYYTHLNPKANYLYRQALDISSLRKGHSVKRVEYSHNTGKFTEGHKIKPNRFIIMCGLHSLYLPQMRKILDIKIFMDCDENLRRYWKIQRDIAHRGYTKEKIIQQIESRMPDAEKYITPQKAYADLVIQYFDKKINNCLVDNHKLVIGLKITISAAVNIEKIIWQLAEYGLNIKYDYNTELTKQIIVFDGEELLNKTIDFNIIANNAIPQIDEITLKNINDNNDNISGIIKLIVLLLISEKMKGVI